MQELNLYVGDLVVAHDLLGFITDIDDNCEYVKLRDKTDTVRTIKYSACVVVCRPHAIALRATQIIKGDARR